MESKNVYLIIFLAILLALISSFSLLLITNYYGLGLTPDSVAYVSSARNLSEGSGLVCYDGNILILQPPLYTLLLALIKTLYGIDPLISSKYFNALLLGLTVFLCGKYFLRYMKSVSLLVIGLISIMISFVFIQVFLFLITESLFIYLVLLFLYYLDKYREKRNFSFLIVFSIAASLSCLTRYIGIVLVLTGFLCILIWGKFLVKNTLHHLAVFLFITIIPLSIWILRNYLISETLVGQRAISTFTLLENIAFFSSTVFIWFFPFNNGIWSIIFVTLLLISIMITIIYLKKNKYLITKLHHINPLILFITLYTLAIIISSTTTAYDKINNRLLSPIFIPVVLIFFFIIDYLVGHLEILFPGKYMYLIFLLGTVFWMKYQSTNSLYNIDKYKKQSGEEYGEKVWRENSLIKYLSNHFSYNEGHLFYSNAPEAVYILANIKTMWSPAKTMYNSSVLLSKDQKNIDMGFRKGEVYLIWFDSIDRKFLFSVEELKANICLVKIIHNKDGIIYSVRIK